jgi:preprotein translocase subunit SecG
MLKTILTVIQLISAVALTAIVLVQSGKSDGLGALTGSSSDTYLGQNKSYRLDAKLAKATKFVAAVFILLTLSLNML